MENTLFIVNIVASYFLWILYTLIFYSKVKNKFIYALIPVFLYTIPSVCIFTGKEYTYSVLLIPVSYILFFYLKGGRRGIETVLIPLPLIISIMWRLMVN